MATTSGGKQYQSQLRDRVYERRFDYDVARRMYATGQFTQAQLASYFSCSQATIVRVLNDRHRAKMNARAVEYGRRVSHLCSSCQAPITNGSAYNLRRRHGSDEQCGRCRQRYKTVRATTLQCSGCKQWLPDERFSIRSDEKTANRRNRLHLCRTCDTDAKRRWRSTRTPEQIALEQQRDRERRKLARLKRAP